MPAPKKTTARKVEFREAGPSSWHRDNDVPSFKEKPMRYMMLIHHDDEALAAAPQQQLWADYAAFNDALAKANGGSTGARLQPAKAAKTLRVRAGRKIVVVGPYADTKEQFAGYFFVDVPTIEEALAWAERCPSSQYGSIEVRPVFEQGGK
jgi:hypothetical protein